MPEAEISEGAGQGVPKLSRLALLLIGAAAVPVLLGWTMYARAQGMSADAIRLPVMAAIVWGVTFTFLSWRRLDEGGKEAIKFAFCWGAGPGMMLAAIAGLVVLMWPQPAADAVAGAVQAFVSAREPSPSAWRGEALGFFLGLAFAIGIQQMLFIWVWVGWWIRRRLGPR
jgi:hypothetical protein